MLTKEEEQFLDYWAVQRTKKRRFAFNVGFSLSVLIVLGIFISIVTGWHKQAAIALRSDSSTILVIVLAAVAIVVFMSVFAARYQKEQHEQRYKELLAKKAAAEKNADTNNNRPI
jgi:di/tricarboxylate transporter